MAKRILILILAALLPLGCLNAKDIADHAYVLALGAERGDTFVYRIVLLVALPQSGGEENAEMKTQVLTAEARTIPEAVETLNASLPLSLTFSRTSLLVLSEPLARDGRLDALLDFSDGALDLYRDVRLLVSRSDLSELFAGLRSETDPSFSKTVTNLETLAERSGTLSDVRYRTAKEALGSGTFDLLIPYCGVNQPDPKQDLIGGEPYPYLGGSLALDGASPVTIMGSAAFSAGSMVGTLSGRHTQLCRMADGSFSEGRMQWLHPEYGTVSVRLRKRRGPKICYDPAETTVALFLTAKIESPRLAEDDAGEFAAWLSEELSQELDRTLSALQKNGSDAMGFGRKDRLRDPFGTDWNHERWMETYRTLPVVFSASVRLSKNGGGA